MPQRHRERFEDKSGASETSVRVHTKRQGQTDHRSNYLMGNVVGEDANVHATANESPRVEVRENHW